MSNQDDTSQQPADENKVTVDAESGHRSLIDHAVSKAVAARARFGPEIGMAEIRAMLQDTNCVRYPTHLAFDTVGIDPGMFAYAQQCGSVPGDGFVLHVHPHFQNRPEDLPALIAYHLVVINYGEIANASVAESFGAALLGLELEDYYQRLCGLADELPGTTTNEAGDSGDCSTTGCGQ